MQRERRTSPTARHRLDKSAKDLERAFESRRSKYIEARSAAYYRVSTELAAKEIVDMERAKSDWDEHRPVCVSARPEVSPKASFHC